MDKSKGSPSPACCRHLSGFCVYGVGKIVFWFEPAQNAVCTGSQKTMSNAYGISDRDEKEIRARDKTCVYCGILMKRHRHASGATIEHFNNDGPLRKAFNLAICCRRCNSSKGTMELLVWFKTPYCRERKINERTVSKPVKEYMRLEKLS